LRNDLIDRLTSHFFDWPQREFLLLLLNTQTKSLLLNNCTLDPKKDFYDFGSFLIRVIQKAPNLVRLSLFDSSYKPHVDPQFPNDLKSIIVDAIVLLKDLQHLTMFGHFGLSNDDFMKLTNKLKNLVSLKVQFVFVFFSLVMFIKIK